MKIKEVCEKTGLTDKAIRYYIRSGLVFPEYNENYTGRRNFNFDESDLERLNQIAVLRKYNFSISSIKEIFDHNAALDFVVHKHINDLKKKNDDTDKLLLRLNRLSDSDFSSTSNLCKALNLNDNLPKEVPLIDSKKPYKLLYSKNKKANRILLSLFLTVVILSASLFAVVFNNIKCITDASIVDIKNGFVGIRIIETDKDSNIEYTNDLYVEDDYFLDVAGAFDEYSISNEKNIIGKDTIVIHAVLHSDRELVKVAPIYESRTGEIIYYNSSYWAKIDDGVAMKSNFVMKSKNCKYKYDIEVIKE